MVHGEILRKNFKMPAPLTSHVNVTISPSHTDSLSSASLVRAVKVKHTLV